MSTSFALNDDCLMHIVSFLDLRSQLSLAEAGVQLRRVFLRYATVKYRRISNKLLEGLSKSETEKFLQIVGDRVTSWNGFYSTHLLPVISEYCPKLKAIGLDYCDTWPESYFSCVTRLQLLQSIEIYAGNRRSRTLSRFILKLCVLPNLRRLTINALDYLGEHLATLQQLHTLEVCNSAPLKPFYILEFCIALKNLSCLRLRRQAGQHINTPIISEILRHCVSLEELSLPIARNSSANYAMIADLPNLKYLELIGGDIPQEIFAALAQRKSQQLICLQIAMHKVSADDAKFIAQMSALRELQCWYTMEANIDNFFDKFTNLQILSFRYSDIDNAHLLMLFDACHNLRFVDLYNCRHISTSVVRPLLKLLHLRRSAYMTHPVELCVKGTQIERNILLAPDCVNVRHMLRLHFERMTGYSLIKCVFNMESAR